MAEEWFTYSDLGERLNISPEAVRQKAIRHRWPRRTANDGKTQVRVDLQDVVATMPQRRTKEPSDTRPTPDQPPVEHPSDTRTIEALENHIATLKDMVAKSEALAAQYHERAEGERQRADTERARADAERDRADRLTARIEELLSEKTTAAEKSVELAQQVEELRTILHRMINRRPWWRRLAG
jgi:DNA primase